MRKGWLVTALISLVGASVFGAGLALLPIVDDKVNGPPARPAVLEAFEGAGPVKSAEEWRTVRVPALLEAFQRHVYGRMPAPAPVDVVERKPLAIAGLKSAASVEEWTLRTRAGARLVQLRVVLVRPRRERPAPLIVLENFCSNAAAFKNSPLVARAEAAANVECEGRLMRPLIRSVFGAHIFGLPFERALARGYALALLHPGEVITDAAGPGLAELAEIDPAAAAAPDRPSAVGLWAWTYSRVLDALEQDAGLDPTRQAVWGHSRYGKAALLAGAFDERIDAVVSLQPGTGGGTLSRSYAGESVAQITQSYPHWFAPAYAAYGEREEELPIDQHQLIALLAPRPLLLGAARQDRWSDPKGAFRAAQGADPAYELLGAKGLDQPKMSAFNPDAEIAVFLRNGLHGVTPTDWTRTLDYLDRQFAKPRSPAPAPAEEPLQATPVRL